ncbi:MAG: hypothetical protein ACK47B_08290 [Armatimonadota bacterium]
MAAVSAVYLSASLHAGPAKAEIGSGATFTGLGALPEGHSSGADGVSGDGSVVVGHVEIVTPLGGDQFSTTMQPFRWTESTGYQLLTDPVGPDSRATAASFDGSVVVGFADGAFRWSEAEGLQRLPMARAMDLSTDGSQVVGMNVRWSVGGETLELGPGAWTAALSADGSAAAGYSGAQAFLWTAQDGLRSIHRRGASESRAWDLSADGRVAVGQAMFRRWGPWRAFRWTDRGGMRNLGTLGGRQSWAFGTDGDGSLVVGAAEGRRNRVEAFVWTRRAGMRSLRKLLLKGGATEVREWALLSATGVSADGSVIVGTGINPAGQREGFRAVVPR